MLKAVMPNAELLFGPMLIGVFLNAILYGVLVVQIYIYWQTYKRDPTWIRYLVLYMLVAETLNTAFDIGMIYEPLVIRFGSPHALTVAPKMLSADAIMTVALSTPVQIFFAWRIWMISRSRLLLGVICILSMSSFIGGTAVTICVTVIPEYARFSTFDAAITTWLASSAVADVIITASLVWSLSKRKTGMLSTDHIVNRIIRLTVQTGLATAFAAIMDVTFFLCLPNTSFNFLWDFFLCKLYSNAVLSSLNARGGWGTLTVNLPTNVLFDDDSDLSGRNLSAFDASRHIGVGNYELETPHSRTAALSSRMVLEQDVEHGVVTKVEEVQENSCAPETQ